MPRIPPPLGSKHPLGAPTARVRDLDGIRRQLELGLGFHQQGRAEDAERVYRQVLAVVPDQPDALNLLGTLYAERKRYTSAIQLIEQALARRKNDPVILNNLSLTYIHAARYEEAIRLLRKAIRINPGFSDAHINLGRALRHTNRHEEAIRCYRHVLQVEQRPAALIGLARALIEVGAMEDAAKLLREIVAKHPDQPYAFIELAKAVKFDEADPEPAQVGNLLERRTLRTSERIRLNYAAGKMMNDLGRYDEAFEHYRAGKRLETVSFDPDAHDRYVDRIIKTFTPTLFDRFGEHGSQSERPIFIVGMPRSGTTMTEQILASHPAVYGAGELQTIYKISHRIGQKHAGRAFPEAVADLDGAAFGELALQYLDAIAELDPVALRVTDKMPHNFFQLGLIQLMFPGARVVHCRRNSVDTCLSCYMNEFSESHGYTRDLAHLGRYYRAYERLMAHWRQTLRLPMMEMPYEETVADPESRARSLVGFAGLDWDARCLAFHESDRAVLTLSVWQVRQPVYRQSVERWRRYEAHLGPLLDALGPLAG